MSDFKTEMFPRIRILMKGRYQYHPWLDLGDEEMLHKAGFYIKDPQTQQEGYNLASVLLFGRDETIRNIVPQYKIDALLRRVDVDRYDDRLFITTNLIVHREYTSGYSGTFTIYKDRVETRNPNNPHGDGLLLPEQFVPHAKNL
jgi:ATP-dependent DNA helicase RecG